MAPVVSVSWSPTSSKRTKKARAERGPFFVLEPLFHEANGEGIAVHLPVSGCESRHDREDQVGNTDGDQHEDTHQDESKDGPDDYADEHGEVEVDGFDCVGSDEAGFLSFEEVDSYGTNDAEGYVGKDEAAEMGGNGPIGFVWRWREERVRFRFGIHFHNVAPMGW